jgi:hypothetical protein
MVNIPSISVPFLLLVLAAKLSLAGGLGVGEERLLNRSSVVQRIPEDADLGTSNHWDLEVPSPLCSEG